jgi:hypothetical protein
MAPRQLPSLPPPNRANPPAGANSGLDKTWGQGHIRSTIPGTNTHINIGASRVHDTLRRNLSWPLPSSVHYPKSSRNQTFNALTARPAIAGSNWHRDQVSPAAIIVLYAIAGGLPLNCESRASRGRRCKESVKLDRFQRVVRRSVVGPSRRSDRRPSTSGLSREADTFRVFRHVSKVPINGCRQPPHRRRRATSWGYRCRAL